MKMRFLLPRPASALLLWALLTPAPSLGQLPGRFPGDPVAGQRLFAQEGCTRCHAIWGNGGRLGPDLGEVGRGRSLMQLAGMFWNHTPRMIETVQARGFQWPTFSDEDLANLISYIYYVKLFDPPGDAALGAQWFQEKRCAECHAVGGAGGTVGPPLDEFARYLAPIPLAASMWNHGTDMRSEQARRGVPLPEFVGSELADIQAFIRTQAGVRGQAVQLLPPPDLERGQQLFRTKGCTRCHGRTGRGTRLAPDLRSAIQQLTASEIAGEMWNHSPRIVDAIRREGLTTPTFQPDELADVLAYLYYLRYEELSGSPDAGARLFDEKGCSRCHSLDGSPSIGPDLHTSPAVLSPIGLTAAMWNHAPSMYARVREAGIRWPLFQGDEMRDLAAYLRTLPDSAR